MDFLFLLTYFLFLAGLLILHQTVRKFRRKSDELIQELETQQKITKSLKEEIEEGKIEFQKALRLISDQKVQTESINANLRDKLISKNDQLRNTNLELVKQNGELRQFSYMVSHNLRAPIAALKGLFNLIDKPEEERVQVVDKMGDVITRMDMLMFDMNKITNVRNEVYQMNEEVNLNEELSKVKHLLRSDIELHDVKIEADFSNKECIYSVKSVVNNIFFTLISNGIKYHSKEQPPRIHILTEKKDGNTLLRIKDFGIGVDLKKNRNKMFKLYSRFNPEIEGKGMGLYLCKMQVESLGGEIEVHSEKGEWTEFIVTFKDEADSNRKILFDNQSASIYYDKGSAMNTIDWKEDIMFGSYKEVYSQMVALQAQYLPKSWLIDFSDQGHIPVEFHLWMRNNIVPTLDKSLKQIFWKLNDRENDDLKKEMIITKRLFRKRGVKLKFLKSRKAIAEQGPLSQVPLV